MVMIIRSNLFEIFLAWVKSKGQGNPSPFQHAQEIGRCVNFKEKFRIIHPSKGFFFITLTSLI